MNTQKVFVVGAGGAVGATAVYALTLNETVSEIVLIDTNEDLALGQAMDISDAAAFTHGVKVRTGKYSEINDNDIIVITAGAAQKPGQTRLDLLKINAGIMKSIIAEIKQTNTKPYIVLVANPVDVMTYLALKESGLPKNRVFGTGTSLESARLRAQLSEYMNVPASQIQAYALGEHGDSTFSALSAATIGSIPLKDFPGFTSDIIDGIDEVVSQKVYHIINTKKATFYGIGQVVSQVVSALRRPQPTIMPVCSLVEGEYGQSDVVMSLPSMVSNQGVQIVNGFPLSDEERGKLNHSAEVLKQAIAELDQE